MFRAAVRSPCSCTLRLQQPVLKRIRLASTSSSPLIQLPTIFASASGKGRSAIQILRISGDDALEVWRKMTVSPKGKKQTQGDPKPRRAILRKVVHPETREILDEGVVLYFPSKSLSCKLITTTNLIYRVIRGIVFDRSTNSRTSPPWLTRAHDAHAQAPTNSEKVIPDSRARRVYEISIRSGKDGSD